VTNHNMLCWINWSCFRIF